MFNNNKALISAGQPVDIMVLGWDLDLEDRNTFLSCIAQSQFLRSNMRLRYSALKCVSGFQVHISSQDHDDTSIRPILFCNHHIRDVLQVVIIDLLGRSQRCCNYFGLLTHLTPTRTHARSCRCMCLSSQRPLLLVRLLFAGPSVAAIVTWQSISTNWSKLTWFASPLREPNSKCLRSTTRSNNVAAVERQCIQTPERQRQPGHMKK